MRQSDGSEILGPNDPRTIVIGIIHVTPGDDRQSVLTAISTQEKLGRDQIVLELPAQNKAFKTAVEFEALRQVASEIEATLVLVVPERSKLATYARKEHFTLYSSLEELTEAEFPPLQTENGEPTAAVEDDTTDHAIVFPVVTPAEQASALPTTSPTPTVDQNQPLPDLPETPTAGLPAGENAAPLVEEDETPTNPGLTAASAPSIDQAQVVAIDATGGSDVSQGQVVTGSLPVPLAPGAGALVPSSSLPPAFFYEPAPPPRRSWRGLIITAVIVLLLIAMGIAFNRPILDLFFPPTATVTITPDSQRLQRTYQFTAVLGIPDPTKDQVDARVVYANSQPQSSSVKTTGQGHVPGQQARGVLTFYNVSTSPQTVPAGTVFFDPRNSNVVVVNDDAVTLPGFDPTKRTGVTGNAHTIGASSSQNIPANDISTQLCCGSSVYVSNLSAFHGGQDPQNFSYVQQSDIDSAAQTLETTLNSQTTQILQSQTHQNERPVGPPTCSPQVQSDNLAGAQASSVTVVVTLNCLGEVYDMQAVQVLAARKLTQEASVHPGPAYAPVGNVVAQVAQATPASHGDVSLTVNALGVWAYQFSDTQRTALAHLIAGKSSQDARSLLRSQPGVHDATITLTGVGVTIVPSDVTHITVNVSAVQALHP